MSRHANTPIPIFFIKFTKTLLQREGKRTEERNLFFYHIKDRIGIPKLNIQRVSFSRCALVLFRVFSCGFVVRF